ncbi:MAG: MBL fold metallo-hydrolase [Acidobacteria bacterium]|nr:MAG: MBL fold metallo-hydrolase [Acidobacteriota bacterium]
MPSTAGGGERSLRRARTLVGRPVYLTGAYLVGDALVDCGPPVTARELLRALEGRRLDSLLVTHHHEDHMGAAALLIERRGLVPRIRASGVERLEHGFPQEAYRRLAWGRPPRVRALALGAEEKVGPFRFEVIPTPGHSPDHACFFERDRGWLFTGDLFLAERLRYLRDDEDLAALIASLEAVARLPVRRVFCAHRGPVRDGPAALRRKAERLSTLRERVRELLAQGLPEHEITRRAVGREGFLTWFSLGRFSARNFVRSVIKQGGAAPRPLEPPLAPRE